MFYVHYPTLCPNTTSFTPLQTTTSIFGPAPHYSQLKKRNRKHCVSAEKILKKKELAEGIENCKKAASEMFPKDEEMKIKTVKIKVS